MTSVQKGGVNDSIPEYIKNKTDGKRSLSDRVPFRIIGPDSVQERFRFGRIMTPGTFHYLHGPRGSGKTHLLLNLMCLLTNGHDGCGEWQIITNIFFNGNEGRSGVDLPKNICHVNTVDELLWAMTTLSDNGRKTALFLDDIDGFYSEDDGSVISDQLEKLVEHRKKLKLLVFCSSRSFFESFSNDEVLISDLSCDYLWSRYRSEPEWIQYQEDTEKEFDGYYMEYSYIYANSFEMADVCSSVTDWTSESKSHEPLFDLNGDASVLRVDDSVRMERFWDGIGNISSAYVPEMYRRISIERKEEVTNANKCASASEDDRDHIIELAVGMKSMGITDDAIQYLLDIAPTTIRRWAEKQGYEWRVDSIEVPYHFKRVRGSNRDSDP